MEVVNTGSNDKAIVSASESRKLDYLTEKELLRDILIELKINNLHLADMRDEELTENDLEHIK